MLSAVALMTALLVQPPPPPKAESPPDPKAARENPLGTVPPPPSTPYEDMPQRDELPDLERVPFPLAPAGEGASPSGAAPSDPRADRAPSRPVPPPPRRPKLSFADLRDPFDAPQTPDFAPPRAERTAVLMPDLRDPFEVRERPRSKKLQQVHLPGDIRDPFAPGLTVTRQRPATHCFPPATTRDGVEVQRPTTWTPPPGCPEPQRDLRDPFDKR